MFSGLKVVPHPTLAFTLGYRPENCVKITTELAKKTKCKFLNFSVNPGTRQLTGPARPGTYRICTELTPSSERVKKAPNHKRHPKYKISKISKSSHSKCIETKKILVPFFVLCVFRRVIFMVG